MRVKNWDQLLDQHVNEWKSRPFAWGTSDCVQLTYTWLMKASLQPLPRLPQYGTAVGAGRILKRLGGFDQAIQMYLGQTSVAPLQAKRGDIGLLKGEDGALALGLCVGDTFFVTSPTTPVFADRKYVLKAWHV